MENNTTPNPAPAAPVPPVPPMPSEPSVPPVSSEPSVPPVPEMPVQNELAQSGAPAQPPEPTSTSVPPVSPVAPTAPVMPTPVNPVYQPGGGGLVGATTPITMPEQPKAPDPIEEELKAPFKAAGPAPGSIGSAVSGPQSQTPNVSFTDPAMADNMKSMASNPVPTGKKKMDRKTLIVLCAVVGIVVLALAVVLILQLTGAL